MIAHKGKISAFLGVDELVVSHRTVLQKEKEQESLPALPADLNELKLARAKQAAENRKLGILGAAGRKGSQSHSRSESKHSRSDSKDDDSQKGRRPSRLSRRGTNMSQDTLQSTSTAKGISKSRRTSTEAGTTEGVLRHASHDSLGRRGSNDSLGRRGSHDSAGRRGS